MRTAKLVFRSVALVMLCAGDAFAEDAPPPQYVISIAQGVNWAEAQTLLSGRGKGIQSTRSSRNGSQYSTLRVTSGHLGNLDAGSTNDSGLVFIDETGDARHAVAGDRPIREEAFPMHGPALVFACALRRGVRFLAFQDPYFWGIE